jgi:uncharacterized protein (DUF927 family)
MSRIQDAQRLVLSFSYNSVERTGLYCVRTTTGEEIHREVEGATLRHFQLQMLDDVFSEVVPTGNVVLECDDTGLVEHFNLRNWVAYRENGWKGTNGDWLPFRQLYEELDQAYTGREIFIRLPDPEPKSTAEKNTE